MTRIP